MKTISVFAAAALAACSSAGPTSTAAAPDYTGTAPGATAKITISGTNPGCPVFSPNTITISAGQLFYFENTTAFTEPLVLANYGQNPIFTLGPTEFSPMISRTTSGTYVFHADTTATSQGGMPSVCGDDQYAHVLVGP